MVPESTRADPLVLAQDMRARPDTATAAAPEMLRVMLVGRTMAAKAGPRPEAAEMRRAIWVGHATAAETHRAKRVALAAPTLVGLVRAVLVAAMAAEMRQANMATAVKARRASLGGRTTTGERRQSIMGTAVKARRATLGGLTTTGERRQATMATAVKAH